MNKRMTQEQLEAIRKRAEAATAGPWELDGDDGGIWNNGGFNFLGTARNFYDDDANFIAHSREDIPALLAEVERYRKIERRLNEEVIRRAYITSDKQLFEDVGKVTEILHGGDTE